MKVTINEDQNSVDPDFTRSDHDRIRYLCGNELRKTRG